MTGGEPAAPGEGPILDQLATLGFEVPSLADLRHSGVNYREAVPVLLAALPRLSDVKTLTEVVRALSVPWARPSAAAPLVDLFERVADPNELGVRWAIGNALEVVWTDDEFDDLARLARDRSFGRSREMIVLGFAKSKRPEAVGVLIELLDDSDVNGHAVKALRKLKAPEARSALKRMLTDNRAWVRKDAQRALDALP